MALQKFDELKSLPYQRYFGTMDLSDNQKQDRIKLAVLLEDFFIDLLYVLETLEYESLEYINKEWTNKFIDIIATVIVIDDSIKAYASKTINQIIETTDAKHETEYFTSEDRAIVIAENESNALYNYEDYQQAVVSGKTTKTWLTVLDERVRSTHSVLDGMTIGINELFVVGNSYMRYPHDIEGSVREIINCRCSILYR